MTNIMSRPCHMRCFCTNCNEHAHLISDVCNDYVYYYICQKCHTEMKYSFCKKVNYKEKYTGIEFWCSDRRCEQLLSYFMDDFENLIYKCNICSKTRVGKKREAYLI